MHTQASIATQFFRNLKLSKESKTTMLSHSLPYGDHSSSAIKCYSSISVSSLYLEIKAGLHLVLTLILPLPFCLQCVFITESCMCMNAASVLT